MLIEDAREIEAKITDMPSDAVLQEIDAKVDFEKLETALMTEGIQKFADPQKALLALIAEKRGLFESDAK